ncbi:unnamed protein product [Orchesella dallaii]|uniref:Mitochondrial fission 1 protein n=1 Tax=Orchesella dallaii TaxID=48710 RepID=A0ABP1PTV6_9HEXA
MADTLTDFVSEDYLQEFEGKYNAEKQNGVPSDDTTFHYAWCLVRSKLLTDVRKGVMFLEQLVKKTSVEQHHKRDYLYYLAVGNARLKEYATALKYIKSLLQLEPGNRQAQELEKAIKKSMESDAIKGVAIAGGGVLLAGALVGLGMSLLKK